MSAPLLGVPVGPDPRSTRHTRSYDHIPHLRELLTNGGWPGVVYAQVCIHNLAHAIERTTDPAHLRPIRGTEYFEIAGPRGVAQMALVGCGTPIPGAAPEAGARHFFTDGEVERLTGHPVKSVIWLREQPSEPAKPAGGAPDAGTVGTVQSSAPRAEAPRGEAPRSQPGPRNPAGKPQP